MQSIGEHLKSEASSAVELGVLSKKLNQESMISLVSSILMYNMTLCDVIN